MCRGSRVCVIVSEIPHGRRLKRGAHDALVSRYQVGICFTRSMQYYGICQGPVGGHHQPAGGFAHDVVSNGTVALVDNGIGQFGQVLHAHPKHA